VSEQIDLFIIAAEPSADLHGSNLIEELLRMRPDLKIAAVAGPRMRKLPIQTMLPMESLEVMGFIDVFFALPRIFKIFFKLRKTILQLNPKAVICIDYPGFNLRLERSLRKKGYSGKLIHYICPTVWAWGKKRIPQMEKTLDLLLTLFPFEKKCFSTTSLSVEYVGHPLISKIPPFAATGSKKLLALFPGSREKEILRNFPLQLKAAKHLASKEKELQIAVSISHPKMQPLFRADLPLQFYPAEKTYELMKTARAAIATSGTVTLELALHNVPTVVNFAIRPLDCFIAQKIFRISLPFYCIVNIILGKEVYPEFFGPNLTEQSLTDATLRLWQDESMQRKIKDDCAYLRHLLGDGNPSLKAAKAILNLKPPSI